MILTSSIYHYPVESSTTSQERIWYNLCEKRIPKAREWFAFRKINSEEIIFETFSPFNSISV
jgi:hypothetical protein